MEVHKTVFIIWFVIPCKVFIAHFCLIGFYTMRFFQIVIFWKVHFWVFYTLLNFTSTSFNLLIKKTQTGRGEEKMGRSTSKFPSFCITVSNLLLILKPKSRPWEFVFDAIEYSDRQSVEARNYKRMYKSEINNKTIKTFFFHFTAKTTEDIFSRKSCPSFWEPEQWTPSLYGQRERELGERELGEREVGAGRKSWELGERVRERVVWERGGR